MVDLEGSEGQGVGAGLIPLDCPGFPRLGYQKIV